MKRRVFLAWAAGSLAAGLGAAAAVRRVGALRISRQLSRLEGFGREPSARLRRHYEWLSVDPSAFDRYLADYHRYLGPLDRFSLPDPDFFTRFLLSTDFFKAVNLAPEHRGLVTYTVFYEPGVTACGNPLARPAPSDRELAATATLATFETENGSRPLNRSI